MSPSAASRNLTARSCLGSRSNVLCRGGSEADTKDFGPAGLDSRFSSGCGRRSLARRRWWRLIIAGDFHGPIGAMRGGAGCAGDADARRLGKQEISQMSRGGNPLIEGFFETVIAVRNIFRGPPRFRGCDPRTERAEHIVVERIF